MTILFTILFAVLPACPSEDSENCAWNAATQGNGTGTSLVNLDGKSYVVPVT